MLAANVDAIVNMVNTDGVLAEGQSLALAFQHAFPENFVAYRRACDAGEVVAGTMLVVDCAPRTPRWIINFPTRRRSSRHGRLDDIRAGLADLVAQVRRRKIGSIAVPALGAELCGVDWGELRPLIVDACGAIPEVRVLLFASTT